MDSKSHLALNRIVPHCPNRTFFQDPQAIAEQSAMFNSNKAEASHRGNGDADAVESVADILDREFEGVIGSCESRRSLI
jgi:hypothetical protein